MNETPATYSAFIHLSVEVIQAATDMIEQVGRLKGIRSASDDGQTHEPYQMDALREAIKKASEALAGYDACQKAGLVEVSNVGFRRYAKRLDALYEAQHAAVQTEMERT